MSRSGYDDGWDDDSNISMCWPSIVRRAKRGVRGQLFFRALVAALDRMPVKELIAEKIVDNDGSCCTLGVLVRHRPEARDLDPEEYDHHDDLAGMLGIAPALVREVEYINDEYGPREETPAERWTRIRGWAEMQILREVPSDG